MKSVIFYGVLFSALISCDSHTKDIKSTPEHAESNGVQDSIPTLIVQADSTKSEFIDSNDETEEVIEETKEKVKTVESFDKKKEFKQTEEKIQRELDSINQSELLKTANEDMESVVEKIEQDVEFNSDPELVDYEEESSEDQEDNAVYIITEKSAIFVGECDNLRDPSEERSCTEMAIIRFLQQHVEYPQEAMENGYAGRVFVEFVVEKDGSVSSGKILKGVHNSIDNACLEVIEKLPNFLPAKQRGKPVRLKFTVPINFSMN